MARFPLRCGPYGPGLSPPRGQPGALSSLRIQGPEQAHAGIVLAILAELILVTAQALLRAGVRDGNIIAGYHTSFDATRPLIARLAVTAQTARLVTGKVHLAAFDFDYLCWRGVRFGQQALAGMAQGGSPEIARDASVTLASVRGGGAPTPMEICANIIVHTQGRGRPRRCWPRIGLKRARMFRPA